MIVKKAVDISTPTKDVPEGEWVAISSEEPRTLLAHNSDITKVIEEAKEKGEPNPLVLRIVRQDLLLHN